MGSPDLGKGFGTSMSMGTDNLGEGEDAATILDNAVGQLNPQIDLQSIDPERYHALDSGTRREADLTLLRAGDENSIAKLDELEPGFEMKYPLSHYEEIAFRSFEGYVNGGIDAAGYESDEWDPEVFEALDEEKERRLRGDSNPRRRHAIDGFKVERWERWVLEEQIRQEREAEQGKDKLPKAA